MEYYKNKDGNYFAFQEEQSEEIVEMENLTKITKKEFENHILSITNKRK